MNLLPHLAARLLGTPLLIHRPKLDVILSVLGTRVGWADVTAPMGFVAPERTAAVNDAIATQSGIAVIPIYGTLVRRTQGIEAQSGLTSYAGIALSLEAALADSHVAGIVLDVDSPGGESSGVFDLADRIRSACAIKPVWAVANDMAFSAAYALASAASRVMVSRTGGVGSIGVVAMHVDQSVKDREDGVCYTAIFAGARKNDLNPHAPITSEAHALLQSEVNRVYDLFATTVARHRGLTLQAVKGTEAGLYFCADAVASGLADDMGTLDVAIEQLRAALKPPVSSLARLESSSAISLTHPPKEISMTNPSPDSAQANLASDANGTTVAVSDPNPIAPNPTPVVTATVSTTAAAPTHADAVEIAQTCALAGRTDLITGFLEAKAVPHQVRSQLLTAQAQESQEIVSRIDPNAAARQALMASNPASPDNPLMQAVKARMGAC